MTLTDPLRQKVALSLALLSTGGLLYLWFNDAPTNAMLGALPIIVGCLSYFYRCSARFKHQNCLSALVKRNDGNLIIKNRQNDPMISVDPINLPVEHIAEITTGRDYLSVILNNGNGHDFFLTGPANDIQAHLLSLLSEQERQPIQFLVAQDSISPNK